MILDATTFPGANIFAKIQNAFAALGAEGGVIDARGHTGNQTISGLINIERPTPTSNKPCHILLPASQFTFVDNSPNPKIRIRGAGIRLTGVSVGSWGLNSPATTLIEGYSVNVPLIEISANSGDARGPQHVELEYLEFVGTDVLNTGGSAVVIKAGQFCSIRHFTAQKVRSFFAVQITSGPTGGATLGSVFCEVSDGRIFDCGGGVDVSGGGNLASSSNDNWVRAIVGSSLAGPVVSNRKYAMANVFEDIEAEGNGGANDVLIKGVADGVRVARLYTESDTLTGPSLLIDSDISADGVREPGDVSLGGSAAAGAGVAQHVSIVDSTFSRTQAPGSSVAVRITHSRAAGLPGPQGTVIRGCFIKNFANGIVIANSDVNGTSIAETRFAMCSANIVDFGTSTTTWNHPGTLRLTGNLNFNPTNTYDIGEPGALPRDLRIQRDALISGALQVGTNATISGACQIGTNAVVVGDCQVGANATVTGRCQINSTADNALEVVNGKIRITSNGKGLDGVTSIGVIRQIIRVNPSNEIEVSPDGVDIRWGRALIPLGTGATPTLGKIGGTGPTAAAQNSWMQVVDHTGAKFWIPVWK